MSLAAYAGQTIHIAFLHDSDDDNRLALDDILVTKASGPSQLVELDEINIQLYPNPVVDQLNVSFASSETGLISAKVMSISGQLIINEKWSNVSAGQQKSIDVSNLNAGEYILHIETENGKQNKTFIKK